MKDSSISNYILSPESRKRFQSVTNNSLHRPKAARFGLNKSALFGLDKSALFKLTKIQKNFRLCNPSPKIPLPKIPVRLLLGYTRLDYSVGLTIVAIVAKIAKLAIAANRGGRLRKRPRQMNVAALR